MSQLKKLAGQTVIYGLGHILSKGFYFIFLLPYLTKRLEGTYDYGLYNELYGYTSLLLVLFSFRMDTALFRFGSKTGSLQSAFSTALFPIVLLALSVLMFGYSFADDIAGMLSYPDKGFYIRWFATIVALDVLMLLPFARLRLENKAVQFTVFRFLNIIITIGLVLLFLDVGISDSLSFIPKLSDVEYVFFANLIASSAMFILMLPIFFKAHWRDVDMHSLKRMLAFAAPLVVVGAANSINQFFGVPLQKFFLGDAVVNNVAKGGIYGAAQKIASLVSLTTVAFNYAAEPFFFRHSANSDDKSIYGKIALAFTIVMGTIVLGIVGYFEVLKHILTDVDKYQSGFILIPILLLAYFFLGLYYNISIWYKLSDKTIYGAVISIIGAIVTLVISISLLPAIGIAASAWAALACYSLMCIVCYVLGQRHYPIPYPVGKILGIVVSIVALIYLLQMVNGFDIALIARLGINTLIIGAYLGSNYLLFGREIIRA